MLCSFHYVITAFKIITKIFQEAEDHAIIMIMNQNDAATEQYKGWAEQMTSYLVADIVPVIEEENEAVCTQVT